MIRSERTKNLFKKLEELEKEDKQNQEQNGKNQKNKEDQQKTRKQEEQESEQEGKMENKRMAKKDGSGEVKKKIEWRDETTNRTISLKLNQTEKMPISFQPLWSRETKRTRSIWNMQQDPFFQQFFSKILFQDQSQTDPNEKDW